MLQFCLIYCLVSIGILMLILKYRPATLWSGVALVNVIGSVLVILALLYLRLDAAVGGTESVIMNIIRAVMIGAMIGFTFLLILFPLLFIATYLIEGIRLIRKEGLRFPNLLSLGFAAGLLLVMFLTPVMVSANHIPWLIRFIFYICADGVTWFAWLLAVLFFSLLANLIHLPHPKKLDYIIVLGCGILGTKVTPLLAGRIKKGIELHTYSPQAKVIFSGGQGEGEDIPEAQAMAAYALEQGLDRNSILIENQSLNTEQNIRFSKAVMEADGADQKSRTAIVTTDYHIFRALMLARQENLIAKGYGSATRLYFGLNAFLRECVGYLSMTRKRQMLIAVLIVLPLALLQSLA